MFFSYFCPNSPFDHLSLQENPTLHSGWRSVSLPRRSPSAGGRGDLPSVRSPCAEAPPRADRALAGSDPPEPPSPSSLPSVFRRGDWNVGTNSVGGSNDDGYLYVREILLLDEECFYKYLR